VIDTRNQPTPETDALSETIKFAVMNDMYRNREYRLARMIRIALRWRRKAHGQDVICSMSPKWLAEANARADKAEAALAVARVELDATRGRADKAEAERNDALAQFDREQTKMRMIKEAKDAKDDAIADLRAVCEHGGLRRNCDSCALAYAEAERDAAIRELNALAETAQKLARADGFTGWEDMRQWFDAEHGLPFDGIVLYWQDDKATNKGTR
jgi:hypothetical protein